MADRHRRQGQRRRRRRGQADRRARSATSSRPTPCRTSFTFADVKNKSGKYIAPTLESTSAAGDGIDVPADLGSHHRLAEPEGLPDHLADVRDHLQGPVQGRPGQDRRPGLKTFLDYLLGAGPGTIKKLSYAKLPAALKTKAKAAVDGMQCNGSRDRAG